MIAGWIALGALGLIVCVAIIVAVIWFSDLLDEQIPGILKGPK